MITDRSIQVFIARVDLFICALLRFAAAVLYVIILLVAVWAAREVVERRDLIDYDGPGVDITSEGP